MTLDKFTIKAQETVQQAVLTARQNGQQSIEPVHLMKALMDKDLPDAAIIETDTLYAGDATSCTCTGGRTLSLQ